MTKTKSIKQLALMAQSIANKLKDFHEDSYANRDANKLVNYTSIHNVIQELEAFNDLVTRRYN